MPKDAVLNVRLEKEVREALVRAAVDDDRTMARMCEKLLREGLEKLGYLKPKPKLKGR